MKNNKFNLDCADYYSHKITLGYNNKKGIYLKAYEHIKKGELLIAEKALFAINSQAKEINYMTGKKLDINDDIITYNYLLEEIKKHSEDYKKLFFLYDGNNGGMNLKI